MEQKNFLAALKSDIIKYVDLKFQYIKLSSFEKTARIASAATSYLIIGFLSLFGIIFLSFTTAIFLGDMLGNAVSGYALVAAFFVLALLGFLFWGRKNLERKISNAIIKILTDDE
ncbi:MAG: phage holin family protein [Bacteroidia bacterium]|nr:phage holin family protein [Bacteroidia bacterium]